MSITTTTWTGATNSDWDTATNWTNGVPSSTTGSVAIIDGAVSITGGQPTNEVISNVYVAYTYTGSIGTSGTPLELDCAQFSYDSSTASATAYVHLLGVTNTTPDVLVDGLKTGEALVLSGDIDRLLVDTAFAGTLTLGNGASFQATPNDFIMKATNGTVSAPNSAEIAWVSSADVYISAGTVSVAENFGTNGRVVQTGGTINVTAWTVVAGDSITMFGGTCNWNAGDKSLSVSSVNAIRAVNVIGGTFTMAGNENAYVSFDKITQWGGTINLESSYANVEIDDVYERFSGSYVPPKQSSISTSRL